MTAADFPEFYKAVHGFKPFPWQERLLERVVSDGWPNPIALPTSSGKTSAIDVAVFHLALEAGKPAHERRSRLRTFFVIDRRVVVDEAFQHATRLAKKLRESDDEIVKSVADALKNFGARLPLDVAILRGGMYRDNTWADEPNQPLVCVSTVDQVGSRLLFRGYQVSDAAKPVHAALVGNDSLIIVDEAHLSNEFLHTLRFVQSQPVSMRSVAPDIKVVEMSATIGRPAPTELKPFELTDADYANHVLGRRLTAAKLAELRSPAKAFEEEVASAAKTLASGNNVLVIGIVVNTVASARSVFEQLRKLKDHDAILLTGRNRPFSSAKLWKENGDKIAARADRPPLDRPLFVVATQTVEVGANIDFDALVSESAPMSALRQRFGRLNRLGRTQESHAILVRRPKEDPVYGDATAKTWEFLSSLEKVNFGVVAMNQATEGHNAAEFENPSKLSPILFPKYLEIWAQTNPTPDPDPDVAPFLHGRDAQDDADIQVVWRADIDDERSPAEWQDAVEAAPPVSLESLALPLGALKRWLRGETKLNVSDLEGAPGMDDDPRKTAKPVLIWDRQGENGKLLTRAEDIRPGDVIIIPSAYGGCDQFGWHPGSNAPVIDIGDEANNEMASVGMRRHRLRLALHPQLAALAEKVMNPPDEESPDQHPFEDLLTLLRTNEEYKDLPHKKPRIDQDGQVLIWPRIKIRPNLEQMKPEDQDDDSAGLEESISLDTHTVGVMNHVRTHAKGCGLGGELFDDLLLAAELHDLGKWDARFQTMLRLCAPRKAAEVPGPLAKSGGRLTQQERRTAQERSGYPKGARHEAASVLLASESGRLSEAHDADLVLHLIGAHHGFGRPMLPPWEEAETETVLAHYNGKQLQTGTGRQLARFDSGWIDRFSLLNARYGYWGLAYLEAILRRADCVQSREEQEPKEEQEQNE